LYRLSCKGNQLTAQALNSLFKSLPQFDYVEGKFRYSITPEHGIAINRLPVKKVGK